MNFIMRFKVMPILIIVAALSFGVRFGDFVTGVSTVSRPAHAKSAADQTEKAPAESQIQMAQALGDAPPIPAATVVDGDGPRTAPIKPSMEGGEEINWKDASDSDLEFSEVRMELFKDLTARRKKLEEREREISVREALLKATEQELNQKYTELVSIRKEIKDLLVEQTDEEKKRIASLVKIYEGMKPKDAARIFNTLDRDVLLNVVSKMSERKSAPVLASMNPDRARTLTIMLMEQKSLPASAGDLMQ